MPTAFVTGSNRGIGLATALRFAGEGWTVFAGVRDPARAEALDAAAKEGLDVRIVPVDVRLPAAIDAAFDTIVAAGAGGTGLDVVVNNAAAMPVGPLEEQRVHDIEATLDTNLLGPALVCRAAAPIMRRQGSGVIVNITSLAGRYRWSPPCLSVYNATKAALVALTYELAKELVPHGVRMLVAELGVWDTPGVEGIFADIRAGAMDGPYGRVYRRGRAVCDSAEPMAGRPEDAAAALYRVATEPADRVRYVIPANAEPGADLGDRLTDAEFLELCHIDDPAYWFERYGALLRSHAGTSGAP